MKISFYIITNEGKGYLLSTSSCSFKQVKEPLEADIFPGLEEVEDYVTTVLSTGWRLAIEKGSYSIATMIMEL